MSLLWKTIWLLVLLCVGSGLPTKLLHLIVGAQPDQRTGHRASEWRSFSLHINIQSYEEHNFWDDGEKYFKIKRSTRLSVLMNAYCDRQSLDIDHMVFLFDGRRIGPEQTVDKLKMDDGDVIDVMQHQFGGESLY